MKPNNFNSEFIWINNGFKYYKIRMIEILIEKKIEE